MRVAEATPEALPAHAGIARATAPLSIGLVSPCGWGNLGDAAIQTSVVEHIRERYPNAAITAFTLNPADTAQRHGIPAYRITGSSNSRYPVARPAGPVGVPSLLSRVIGRIEQLPLVGRAVRLAQALRAELGHWVEIWGHARRLDLLVFSGGGQLDEFWGGPWGHPYVLWKWALISRARGVRVVALSVGYGSLDSMLGRTFVRSALRLTSYQSYRDRRTHELVRRLGVPGTHPVVPDLAFGYPVRPMSALRNTVSIGGPRMLTVGFSPISYRDPRVWPEPSAEAYGAYVRTATALVGWLLKRGCRVVFFSTARSDKRTVSDIRAQVRADLGPAYEKSVIEPPIETTEECLSQLALVDCVVASRLHSVILSHLAEKPVLALSYDWKVEQQMRETGHSEFSLPIGCTDLEKLTGTFQKLENARDELASGLRQTVELWRSEVSRQYDEVLV